MKITRRRFGLLAASSLAVGVSGCSKFRTYRGPEVTSIFVHKSPRQMYLLHHDRVLRNFQIDLGFAPIGHKQKRGDGRTPEGRYVIDRRNPDSKFHLSLGIDYPNRDDLAAAEVLGLDPGGDIFIHGEPNEGRARGRDWTFGCIAVRNREIEDIYAMVQDGCPVTIRA